jgi:hypothetical protein
MRYYFRTGKTTVYDAVKEDAYTEKQQKEVAEFIEKFQGDTPKLQFESTFIKLLGKMNDADTAEIEESWVTLLTPATEEVEEETKLPKWAVVLIVVGSVLVVATAVLVHLLMHRAKVKAKKREEEATVNAYRRKRIDTTDDKTIDVYATEESSEEEKEE